MISNLAVVSGTVPVAPTIRELPDGGVVAQFDVGTTVDVGGRRHTQRVPVAWYDPPAVALGVVSDGVEVVVVGTVRRRFFRVGGVTQSRTEVVADSVVPARRRKQAAAALDDAAARLR
jgi:single-strand DNA-binding protein